MESKVLKLIFQSKHEFSLKQLEINLNKQNSKRSATNDLPNEPPSKKQLTVERWGTGSVTQSSMDTSILNFVIEEMQPLSIVDKPSFINLVRLGCSKNITIMSSKTLKNKIKTMHGEMETSLCDTLEKVSVVTVAADLWSKAKR